MYAKSPFKSPTPTADDDVASTLACVCPECYSMIEGKDLSWLSSSAWQLVFSGTLLGIAFILRRFEPNNVVHSNYTFRWFYLVSFCFAMYVGGRFINWAVCKVLSQLALISFLSDAIFYALAVDGIIEHIVWIVVGVSCHAVGGERALAAHTSTRFMGVCLAGRRIRGFSALLFGRFESIAAVVVDCYSFSSISSPIVNIHF